MCQSLHAGGVFWLATILFGLSQVPVGAQIVLYSFTGGLVTATAHHSHLIADEFAGSNSPSLSSTSGVYTLGSGSHYITQNGWMGSAPNSAYFQFTLAPDSGYELTITGVSFGYRATATGPTLFHLRSSLQDYSFDLISGAMTNDSEWHSTGELAFALGSADPLIIRIYADGASGGSGTLRIDDFALLGSVTPLAIPEPSNLAMIGGLFAIGAALLVRRRAKTAAADSLTSSTPAR